MRTVRRIGPWTVRLLACACLFLVFNGRQWAAPAAIRIDTIAPVAGRQGDVVTVTGLGFSASSVRVKVGTTAAAVVDSTRTKVRFKVPTGLPPGPTTVTVINPNNHTGSIPFSISAPSSGAAALIAQVQALPLAPSAKSILVRTLTALDAALVRGEMAKARVVVNAFVIEVRLLQALGQLSPATSADLIAKARALLRGAPPTADAGPDQTVRVTDVVQLNGSASTDAEGHALTYRWSLVAPDASHATLSSDTLVNPTFVVDMPGTYLARLIVNDGILESLADEVRIDTTNSAPSAQAGLDQTGPVGTSVSLDGSLSLDVDGDPITYAWTLDAAPAGSLAALDDPTAPTPSFDIDRPGTYEVSLVVSDGQVSSAPDTVVVSTVSSAPVARAGPDQLVSAGDTVVLDGSGSTDVDGDALAYAWSVTSSPSGTTELMNPTGEMPAFVADLGGTYVLQLIVSDGTLESLDTVTVVANTAPLVTAAVDPSTVVLPGTASLTGTATDDGVPAPPHVTLSWTASGPEVVTLSAPEELMTTATFAAPGVYQFTFKADDGRLSTTAPAVTVEVVEDRCATGNGGCDPLVTCTNTVGGPQCGSCPAGYTGSGAGCVDIDECQVDNGGCDPRTQCTNAPPGSRTCGECPAGFTGTGATGCVDIDECQVNNGGCDRLTQCTNDPPGSRTCGDCPVGYSGTGETGCVDVNECEIQNGGCDPRTQCVNTAGTRTCGPCPAGFTGDGVNGCVDINECQVNNGGCDPRTQCTNDPPGSRTCGACPAGFSGTGETGCVDINECQVNNGGCDRLTQCTNDPPGSRTCGDCPVGYSGTGETGCVDINECEIQNGGCDPRTECVNTAGTRTCGPCPQGFTGDGLNGCVDINECQVNNGGCDPRTQCTNDPPGSRTCGDCPAGFSGTGETGCVDVDECQVNNGGCDPLTQCTNDPPGSRTCGDCPVGYSGAGETGLRATSTNARSQNGGCDPRTQCVNTAGSRTCGPCPPGFTGDGLNGCVGRQRMPGGQRRVRSADAMHERSAGVAHLRRLPGGLQRQRARRAAWMSTNARSRTAGVIRGRSA